MLYDGTPVEFEMPLEIPPRPPTRKARKGCLGCIGQVMLLLIGSAVILTVMTGVFYPWGFYLGGKFHIIPMWQGWGRMHGKGGDYLVWGQFEPTPRGSKM